MVPIERDTRSQGVVGQQDRVLLHSVTPVGIGESGVK
jgi:hypothetical protein